MRFRLRAVPLVVALSATLLTGAAAAPLATAQTAGPAPVEPGAVRADEVPPAIESPAPLGANDWRCKPTTRHPRPVILLHGFSAPSAGHWSAFAPYLKTQGYCVFTITYGAIRLPVVDLVGGFQPMEYSAQQLAMFVDKVRAATGVSQVDLVGHSEGGIMPRYYLKNLGGAAKVHNFVAWAPPNHGTSLSGLYTLAKQIPGFDEVLLPTVCKVCTQLVTDSPFIKELNSPTETVPGVHYTVVTSKNDVFVTPIETSYLSGPNVDNISVQDVNPKATPGHITMAFSPTVYEITTKALSRD
ncbi:Lipase (class 2) [Amycolatopsis arida]|uniref:Lipase (Class 2) n=1 Tax=Amycolatopsis arida TaxID=587909 RepID=A0A1I5ZS67_9PSEU|nr:alpha/beta fold hydrolase [Amycolatopsis arida]TDX89332.1 lipase (class 2) [Amycolatopsis arida]SFQ59298.1 Lipase (class 2) [Amycolatopsis arida]